MSAHAGVQPRTLGHSTIPAATSDLVEWYRRTRARTRALFEIPAEDTYYTRPIALRNPIVFYEGHFPAFAINTLVKKALGQRGIDESLEVLFARGIDPADESAVVDPTDLWPSRATVKAYAREADTRIERALVEASNMPDASEALFTILEHELMHQETLLYMLHNLPHEKKIRRAGFNRPVEAADRAVMPALHSVEIPAGPAILGADRSQFGWDNEFPRNAVRVNAFEIDNLNVTNAGYLEFMNATGASAPHFWIRRGDEWLWRGMFEAIPLPLDWPVFVTHEEAKRYAQWKGLRLPTEAEYHRALGTSAPSGNFDFTSFDPMPVGSFAPNELGIYDLVGNGWEWTSTPFGPFEGFAPMRSYPEYSADFFDDQHFVLKGASPVTPRELVRPSFRNWFRPNYPFVYATFRCAK